MNDTSTESVRKTSADAGGFPRSQDPTKTPFTVWTVFRRTGLGTTAGNGQVAAFEALVARLTEDQGITLRGAYDVSAMRQGADVMLWLVGAAAEGLQQAIRQIRRSELFSTTEIAWSAMGVHREAEFAKDHIPTFMRPGFDAKRWLCVYPFVRSYEWYLLPAEERGHMLREHGLLGRDFPTVMANTVSSFALGDWEWLLGLEADELTDLVDLMRHLRATDARLHVREEVPFYTGRFIDAAGIAEVLR